MTIFLIIPCFNEAERLNKEEFLKQASENYHFIFANDGSSDETLSVLKSIKNAAPDRVSIYDASENRGKAEVIRRAFLQMDDEGLFQKEDMIGYWDADLATPIWEAKNMIRFAEVSLGKVDAIWGSRLQRLGADIKRSPKRHYLGRAFALLVGVVLRVKSYDSQCGAKLFNLESARKAFKDPFISTWIFDIEILLRLKNERIIEYPLRQWHDIPGSKVNIGKELPRVLKDIFKIRSHYLRS